MDIQDKPEVVEICKTLKEWYDKLLDPFVFIYTRLRFEDKIYIWLINNKQLDLYKYCLFVNTALHKNLEIQLLRFLNERNIYVSTKIKKINSYVVNFYKDKYHKMDVNSFNIYLNYSKHLFGEVVHDIDKYYKHLTLEQAKYLLTCNFNGYSYITTSPTTDNIKFIRFVLECQKLGINRRTIQSSTKISDKQYDLIDKTYYEYLKYGTNDTYERYLAKKQYKTDSIACMEYLRAVYNTSLDLNGDVAISADSIKQIMTIANIDKHLDEK